MLSLPTLCAMATTWIFSGTTSETRAEHTVLLSQVVDHILLLAVDPASQNEQ